MSTFTEIADGVYLLRYPVLDVNSTLIVGGECAVVVDTLSTQAQAAQLLAAVRAVTQLPLVIINTHHHFDHTYGNNVLAAASPGAAVWAHEAAAHALRSDGALWQREWYDEWHPRDPELAEGLAAVDVLAPNRTVQHESTMDIGDRVLELRHLGRGHTDGDLVVAVPDAGILLAGDLIEQGAPPSFGDSFPIDWPDTVHAMLHLPRRPPWSPGTAARSTPTSSAPSTTSSPSWRGSSGPGTRTTHPPRRWPRRLPTRPRSRW